MNIFGAVTSIVGLGAEFGLNALIGNVVGTVTTKSGNKIVDKVCIGIGTTVLSCMAGDAVKKYVDNKSDEIKEKVTKNIRIEKKDLETDDIKEDKREEEVEANE